MARSRFGHWALLAGVIIVLAGCEEGAGLGGQRDDSQRLPQAGGVRVTEQDVEAPDVFQANETGLWDGRPSLGGVWIAHPSVTNPERVVIRNQANGREIVGALFRRERENPGPRIQISSDAAAELGILAGQPTQLSVVALRRREVPEALPQPIPAEEEAAAAEPEAAPESDAGAIASAATAAIEATEPAAAEPEPVAEEAPPSSLGQRRRPEDAAAAEPQPVPEDAPPTSLGRRSRPAAAASGGVSGEITVAPLDGPEASAGAAPEAAAAAPAASGLDRPYVQAAIFGTEANAKTAADGLRSEGLEVALRQTDSNGTTYWRVIVGPAATAAERTEILEKVKRLGYRDAYPVRG